MPNLSKPKTRKQLVLERLQATPNEWVPGMDLMTKEVGGTRAGARIFDLREDGHKIVTGNDPNSDVDRYMLVVKPTQLSWSEIPERTGGEG